MAQQSTSANALTFQSTTFDVVSRDGQPWLRAADIARALGYANDNAITRIFARNETEFTSQMSEKVKLTLSGNLVNEVRIFSLRGAHLLGMFARTEKAAEFRRWVLDVLEGQTQALPQSAEETLTPSEQQTLKEVVHRKAAQLGGPAEQGKLLASIWSRLQNKFRVARYQQLPRHQLSEALMYIAEVGQPKTAARVPISSSQRKALAQVIEQSAGAVKFKRVWRAAVWAHLRRQCQSKSPEPIYEDQLSSLALALQQVVDVSQVVLRISERIERQAVQRILVQQQDWEDVAQEMQREVQERLDALPRADQWVLLAR